MIALLIITSTFATIFVCPDLVRVPVYESHISIARPGNEDAHHQFLDMRLTSPLSAPFIRARVLHAA